MTDKFLSGWGEAEGRTAKYVYECSTYQEAEIVKDNAEARSDQKHINICINKPRYNAKFYRVAYHTKEDGGSFYTAGYFRQRAADQRKRELEGTH